MMAISKGGGYGLGGVLRCGTAVRCCSLAQYQCEVDMSIMSCSFVPAELDLSDNWLTYHSCAALLPLMRNKPPKSAVSIARSMRRLNTNSGSVAGSVAHMRLSRNDHNGSFLAGLNQPPKQIPVLTDLNLSGNPIGNKVRRIELVKKDLLSCYPWHRRCNFVLLVPGPRLSHQNVNSAHAS